MTKKTDPLDRKLYMLLRTIKDPALRLFVAPLALLRITPNMVTYAGIASMAAFAYYAPSNILTASWFFVGAVVADWLDGSLARYTNNQNPLGKFTDITSDQVSLAFFVFGAVRALLIPGSWAVLFIFFSTLSKVFLLIQKGLAAHLDFHAMLTSPPHMVFPNIFLLSSYFLFAIYVLFGLNYFAPAITLFTVLLMVKVVIDFRTIKATDFSK